MLIPKDTEVLHLGSAGAIATASDLIGDLVTNLTAVIDVTECYLITSIEAPNATQVNCTNCTGLITLSALKATVIVCDECDNLTTQSIYDVLDNAYKLGQAGAVDGVLDFGGGTASIDVATISQRHGITYDAIITYLAGDPNWTITVNEE